MPEEITIDSLFKLSNDMALYVGGYAEGFGTFLRTAAFTLHNTVSNQLIIMSYSLSVTGTIPQEVKSAEEWFAEGIGLREGAIPYYVMEKSAAEKGYKPKQVFDISMTDASGMAMPQLYDKGLVLERLIVQAPCEIVYTDNLKVKGTKAMYMPEEDKIHVTKGFTSFDEIFSSLAMEFLHRHYAAKEKEEGRDYKRGAFNDSAYAGAYMIASRYGMDTSSYSFDSIVERLKGADNSDIKKVLENIVTPGITVCKRIDSSIDAYLEAGDVHAARA